ncbi:MAG: Ig-like domain-containing protein [Bacillota bacterium]
MEFRRGIFKTKTMKCFLAVLVSLIQIFGIISVGYAEEPAANAASTTHIVISEIYGGGGNSGATYKNDFIELYNPTAAAVDLSGWSVQYTSAAGTSWNAVTNLGGSIAPYGYYLVQQAAGAGGTTELPVPDAIGNISMSGTAGKVRLVDNAGTVIDFVGFGSSATPFEGSGPTVAPSNTNSVHRLAYVDGQGVNPFDAALAGNGWDSDNNNADFVAGSPEPQNSSITEGAAPAEDTVAPQIVHIPVESGIVGAPVDITAEITDVSSVTARVYYGTTPDRSLMSDFFIMTNTAGSSYIATLIPEAEGVLYYYIEAVDTNNNQAFLPQDGTLYAIAVSSNDTTAPVINHTPVQNGNVGTAINISAEVTDISPLTVSLYYRTAGTEEYTTVGMIQNGSIFSAEIPAEAVTLAGVEYYIQAVDSYNNSTSIPVCLVAVAAMPTIAEVRAMAIGTVVKTRGVVTYIDGSNYYIQDSTAAIDLYKSGLTLQLGDLVEVTGEIKEYRGLLEIVPVNITDVVVVSSGNAQPEPLAVTIDQINESIESMLVKISNVTIGTINTGGNTVITDASNNTINIYKIPALTGISAGDKVDIIAIVSQYNTTYQLRVRNASEVTKADLGPDIIAPVIVHTPVTEWNTSFDLTIKAQVTDDRQVSQVKLYYRTIGFSGYTAAEMQLINGEYAATISKEVLRTEGLEYYIEAADGTNTVTLPSDTTNAYRVSISSADLAAPTINNLMPAADSSVGSNVRPVIGAGYSDASAIKLDTVKLYVDDIDVTAAATISETNVLYIPSADLTNGEHTVKIVVADEFNNSAEKIWKFSVGEEVLRPFYGQLHAHTNFSDGQGSPSEAFAWAKDVADADFFAITDHSNSLDNDKANENLTDWRNSTSVEWKQLNELADSYTDESFVGIAGFEMTWSGSTGGWGHINTFNSDWFASRNNSSMNLQAYYNKIAADTESISQLNHPGKTFGDFADFGFYSKSVDNVVKLIEVGNGEGPVRGSGYFPSYEYYTRALDKGWHVAPSNNQDNHKANWVTANEARTVVLAPTLSRESIYEAIRLHRVYSTEDRNLKISYKVNGKVMGSFLNNPEILDISISLGDPDASDTIRNVEIVADGGTIVASKQFDASDVVWEVQLAPQYNYYYIKVTQGDKDIAVTAPVWTGEVTPVGISKVEASQNPTIVNTPVKLAAAVFNNSSTPLSNVIVEFFKDSISPENKIGESIIPTINSGSTSNGEFDWVPSVTGSFKIYAQTVIQVEGNDKVFTNSTSLDVGNKEDILKVVVDAGHFNHYVSGDYKGKLTSFKGLLQNKKVMVVENADEITAEDLDGASVLVLTDPQSKDDTRYNLLKKVYSDAEVAVIKQFVENGGSIIITSRADYKDAAGEYGNAAQSNKVLEAVGANLRVNDDEVIDNTTNGGQNYRLYFKDYTSTKYNLTANVPADVTYSFYSGCSVVLKPEADMSAVDIIVKGLATTETMNADNVNDSVPVAKGDVIALAAEVLPGGGKVVVAGTTFFSDFEMTGDNAYTNVQITENIMNWLLQPKPAEQKSIAEVRIDENNDGKPDLLGKKFTIEGIVTAQSVAMGTNNAFFDVIYVQDATGGITVFGVATKAVPLGARVKVTGVVDQYDGDAELSVANEETGIIIMDMNPVFIEPRVMTTGDSMLESSEGWLIKTEGTVTRMTSNTLYLNDGSGEARIYVNGYIGDGTNNPDMLGKWDSSIKVGDKVSAVGLGSEDPEGHRLRVRNTAEIVKLTTSVSGIEMNIEAAELEVDRTLTLTATVLPQDADNKEVLWSSSDETVATVVNGVVSGKAEGTAIITATTVDGGYTAQCVVKVIPVKVRGITLDKTEADAKIGRSITLTATITPEDAKNKSIIWTSSNNEVAVVSDGVVTGKAEGEVIITATTVDGGFSAACTVKVTPVEVESIVLDKNVLDLTVGNTAELTATILPADATNKELVWTTSDSGTAVVENGIVTAVGAGTAVITVTSADGKVSAQCSVNVTAKAELKLVEYKSLQRKVIVTLSLKGVKDITAVDMYFNYNKKLLDLQKVQTIHPLTGLYEENKKAGMTRLIVASEGAENAMNGDVELVRLTFKIGARVNEANISVDGIAMSDSKGVESFANGMTLTINTKTGAVTTSDNSENTKPSYEKVNRRNKYMDINGDGIISIGDLGIVGYHFGKNKKSPDWSEASIADINGNKKVDKQDAERICDELF